MCDCFYLTDQVSIPCRYCIDTKCEMNQQQLEIEDSGDKVTESSAEQNKLRDAYVKERTYLEVVEIELNRSKIIMIDEQGRKKRVPILSEH
ncbi:conserved hypothetical protein [Vibrio chagasii]|nr:conserved hypothetical protein [Vibrio chagasii]CAH6795233.1 conserved hypothetical protein [Vibrio chagasii]CAH6795777.1 conserved hypothetical protein [Vibrio chagasii]CAH6799095.1 conserved hypothetical protein [Vibrio chagasii]CAH6845627.1 conserved hypothetical protein [Vibrio chagasii]